VILVQGMSEEVWLDESTPIYEYVTITHLNVSPTVLHRHVQPTDPSSPAAHHLHQRVGTVLIKVRCKFVDLMLVLPEQFCTNYQVSNLE
jgi:hypothetical protein